MPPLLLWSCAVACDAVKVPPSFSACYSRMGDRYDDHAEADRLREELRLEQVARQAAEVARQNAEVAQQTAEAQKLRGNTQKFRVCLA